ncbi:class I SAM-dependent methyltransferase [Radiobacillus kanasensis]|uniref:class I SAM-dependent methyltransferase n=1 Tax=Radiobacillus kanasensis TaxID=2844358 RepID=UPI001E3E1923|nr:class I SAM-dependent methyltransferase [Radiobacillus kanasensis]UFT99606.1 class I SAM-dependent methyltransferase [Radiobacillus kanasensis]
MDTVKHNQAAWDKKVNDGAVYTKPVSGEEVAKSKQGNWSINLTPTKTVPQNWFPNSLKGLKVLCLASGGGQQGPVLAAAGADVTVVDISQKQLDQDELVAKRDGLSLQTIQGSMSNLHFFEDGTFDMVIHPVANLFVEDVKPVWQEAARVLKENGSLLSGFANPLLFIFDDEQEMRGNLEVKHSIPFSTLDPMNEAERENHIAAHETIEYGHTLEDQIQGQIEAGFMIAGFYEDNFGGSRELDPYINTFMVTRAIKRSDI